MPPEGSISLPLDQCEQFVSVIPFFPSPTILPYTDKVCVCACVCVICAIYLTLSYQSVKVSSGNAHMQWPFMLLLMSYMLYYLNIILPLKSTHLHVWLAVIWCLKIKIINPGSRVSPEKNVNRYIRWPFRVISLVSDQCCFCFASHSLFNPLSSKLLGHPISPQLPPPRPFPPPPCRNIASLLRSPSN